VIKIIDSPTEQTTAATDALITLVAIGCVARLRERRQRNRWKVDLWSAGFGLMALSGALGAAAHGFQMSKTTNDRIWMPLNLSLGLTVALFVVGAVYDAWGEAAARRLLLPMLVIGVAFFGVTRMVPGSFTVFIVYEAVALLFALAVYGRLALGGQLSGAQLMAAGILISIIAAAVQASPLSLRLIWEFDHNGLFHLIQLMGLPVIAAGLRAALADSPFVPAIP
jgi:hypothetical protein